MISTSLHVSPTQRGLITFIACSLAKVTKASN